MVKGNIVQNTNKSLFRLHIGKISLSAHECIRGVATA